MSWRGWFPSAKQIRANLTQAAKNSNHEGECYVRTEFKTRNFGSKPGSAKSGVAPADVDDTRHSLECSRGHSVRSPGGWLYLRPVKTERDEEGTGLDNSWLP